MVMNVEQLYEKQKIMPLFRPSKFEGLYNVNRAKKWSIRQDCLYYVTGDITGMYHLWCVDLTPEGGEKTSVLSFVSPFQGEDFSVLYAANGLFIYRVLPKGTELFRWKSKDGVLTALPRQFIKSTGRIIGFDMTEVYCEEHTDGSYSIFALNIDNGTRREIYKARKELGEVLVLSRDLIVYDFEYDEDSISSPLTNYDFHLIGKHDEHPVYSFDAYSHLVDADHELIWSVEEVGTFQYLVPLSIMRITAGGRYEERVAPNAQVLKLSGHVIYGDYRNYSFNGFTLLQNQYGKLVAYNVAAQKSKVLANECRNFGSAGKFFYVTVGNETGLYLQKSVMFFVRGTVEQRING